MRAAAFGCLLALLALAAAPARAGGADCREIEEAGARYTVCTVDLRHSDLRLYWRDPEGQPYRTFTALADGLAGEGERLAFAMNAGMYGEDYAPLGLYIEDGERLVKANTRSGWGNFHLKPNGIFYWSADGAGVMETGAWLKRRPDARFATQSGPMLVIDGRIHPRFKADSDSLKIRNGVGVVDRHLIYFVISESRVNFHTFAALFRDRLDCDNALYLDGSISRIYYPAFNREGLGSLFGPMIAVVEPDGGE